VLGGFGIVLWTAAILRRQWRRALGLSAVGLVWVLCACVYCALTLRHASQARALQTYWHPSFMPLPPTSLSDLAWFPRAISDAFHDVGGYRLTVLPVTAFAAGFVVLARRCRETAFALVVPFAVAILASGLRLYPFSSRLLLFLLPFMCLLVGAGAEWAWMRARGKWRALAALLILMLAAFPAHRAVSLFIAPGSREEVRPVLAYIAEHRREGDVLYAYRWAYKAYCYYDARYGMRDEDAIRGGVPPTDRAGYEEEFRQLEGRGRTWVVLSHINDAERDATLAYLDTIGTRMADVQAEGASAYLYEMGPRPAAEGP
jgi:hypothetical protein